MVKQAGSGAGQAMRLTADPRDVQHIAGLMQQRQFDQARGLLDGLQSKFPKDMGVAYLSGVLFLETGEPDKALPFLDMASKREPKNAVFAFNKGKAEFALGLYDKAATSLKKATKNKPDFADAFGLLGDAYRSAEKPGFARTAYEAALKVNGQLAFARHGLGLLSLRAGDYDSAAEQFQELLKLLPETQTAARATAYANLGLALELGGQPQAALMPLLKASRMAPDNSEFRRALVQNLRFVKAVPEGDAVYTAVLDLIARQDVNPRSISSAVQACLRQKYRLDQIFDALGSDAVDEMNLSDQKEGLAPLVADKLFLSLLQSCPVTDVHFELLLTKMRETLLRVAMSEAEHWALSLDFVSAMAEQCFLNEYVFYVTEDETAQVCDLAAGLEQLVPSTFSDRDWLRLALFACYEPLSELGVDYGALGDIPVPVRALIQEQVTHLSEEAELAESVPGFGETADDVSQSVRRQYEENPYPRWTRYDIGEPEPLAAFMRSELPHVKPSELPQTEHPRVLIAGCGTGLQTMKAVCTYKDASILAIDLSRSSLAYGMRKLAEYGVDNVEFAHANILDLGALPEKFDVIESYGVIHHMDDPARALGILSGLLKPGGLIYLGLYSEAGRQSVVEARQLIAERGYADDVEGIRQARHDIMHAHDDRTAPLLSPASDFWTTSDTRDLIFHVQEHRFDLMQIGDMLERHHLEFLGLVLKNAGDRLLFSQDHPDPKAARSIATWHAFEQAHPNMFGDTYKIWARRLPDN